MAYLGLYPRKMASGGPVDPRSFFLPRAVPALTPDFGEKLRSAGVNTGVSWGPEDIQFGPEISPDQIARVRALATAPNMPAAPPGSTSADAMRFLAMRDNGALPDLPGVGGGGDGNAPPSFTTGAPPSSTIDTVDGPATTQGNISEGPTVAASYTGAGRSGIQDAIDQAVSAR
jgi:hypothetical protein